MGGDLCVLAMTYVCARRSHPLTNRDLEASRIHATPGCDAVGANRPVRGFRAAANRIPLESGLWERNQGPRATLRAPKLRILRPRARGTPELRISEPRISRPRARGAPGHSDGTQNLAGTGTGHLPGPTRGTRGLAERGTGRPLGAARSAVPTSKPTKRTSFGPPSKLRSRERYGPTNCSDRPPAGTGKPMSKIRLQCTRPTARGSPKCKRRTRLARHNYRQSKTQACSK
jgi:hypothetical protein